MEMAEGAFGRQPFGKCVMDAAPERVDMELLLEFREAVIQHREVGDGDQVAQDGP
jgi:hypothetical protein